MTDIIEILQEAGVEYKLAGEHHHCTQNYAQVNCCFCLAGNFTLGISLYGTHASCWRCGNHHIVETLSKLTGLSIPQIRDLLRGIVVDIPEAVKPAGKLQLPKGIKPLSELPAHRRYLRGRGFDWREIERLWGVRGIGLAAKYAWSLFIPITYQGKTVSWTTRTLGNKGQRYDSAKASAESVCHKNLLYGEDYVRDTVLVCEGPTDVWAIGPGAVCTFGIQYGQAQVAKIAKYKTRIIGFDNEPQAQAQAKKLVNDLSGFPGETLRLELDAKDPGESSREERKQIQEMLNEKDST